MADYVAARRTSSSSARMDRCAPIVLSRKRRPLRNGHVHRGYAANRQVRQQLDGDSRRVAGSAARRTWAAMRMGDATARRPGSSAVRNSPTSRTCSATCRGKAAGCADAGHSRKRWRLPSSETGRVEACGASQSRLPPVMVYADDVTHILTEEGIAYLHRCKGLEQRMAAIRAVAGYTSIGLQAKPAERKRCARPASSKTPRTWESIAIVRTAPCWPPGA